MRGHEQIIPLRIETGIKPKMIYMNDFECDTDWFDMDENVTVSTAGDNIEALDLRFVIGCSVIIASTDKNRAKALLEACKEHGATVVAASEYLEWSKPAPSIGWLEVWRKENA
jgi:hypothetical protein